MADPGRRPVAAKLLAGTGLGAGRALDGVSGI